MVRRMTKILHVDVELMDGSDKQNFLNGKPSHLLYLWEFFKSLHILDSVKAMLPSDCAAAGDNVPVVAATSSANKKRKMQQKELEEQKHFRTNFSQSFDNLVSTQHQLVSTQNRLADSHDSMVAATTGDNIVRAANALAETEIKYLEALESEDVKRQSVYKRKMEIIKQQITKMGGTIPE